jgi:hypothetical protein
VETAIFSRHCCGVCRVYALQGNRCQLFDRQMHSRSRPSSGRRGFRSSPTGSGFFQLLPRSCYLCTILSALTLQANRREQEDSRVLVTRNRRRKVPGPGGEARRIPGRQRPKQSRLTTRMRNQRTKRARLRLGLLSYTSSWPLTLATCASREPSSAGFRLDRSQLAWHAQYRQF